jgi:hypothetical protein
VLACRLGHEASVLFLTVGPPKWTARSPPLVPRDWSVQQQSVTITPPLLFGCILFDVRICLKYTQLLDLNLLGFV